MTNKLNQILAQATVAAAAALGAGSALATGSNTPPGGTTTPNCTNCPPAGCTTNCGTQPITITNTTGGNTLNATGGNVTLQPGAIAPAATASAAGGIVQIQPGAIAPAASASAVGGNVGPINNQNQSSAVIGAGAGAGGGANVNFEGTRIPRATLGINLGAAQAYARSVGLLHRCKDDKSNGWNLLGIFATSDGETKTDQKCLEREFSLEEKQIVCRVAAEGLNNSNPLVVQHALNAMGEVCDERFKTALTTTRNDFKHCARTGRKVNVIGECETVEARPVVQQQVAPASVPVAVVPAPVAAPAPVVKSKPKSVKKPFTGCSVIATTKNACTPDQRDQARKAALDVLAPKK